MTENRLFKFRAWDKKANGWNNNVKIDKDGSLYPMTEEDKYDWSIDCLQLIIMQYTGLKDKNAKEIYEGDIITCENYTMYGGKYKVCWRQDFMAFMFDLELVSPDYLHDAEGIEVIGNIYENPQLLNQ